MYFLVGPMLLEIIKTDIMDDRYHTRRSKMFEGEMGEMHVS